MCLIIDDILRAFNVSLSPVRCSDLEESEYAVYAIKRLKTKYSENFILLLGDELKAVRVTYPLRNLIRTGLSLDVQHKLADDIYGCYIFPSVKPLGTLKVVSSGGSRTVYYGTDMNNNNDVLSILHRPSKGFQLTFTDDFIHGTE